MYVHLRTYLSPGHHVNREGGKGDVFYATSVEIAAKFSELLLCRLLWAHIGAGHRGAKSILPMC